MTLRLLETGDIPAARRLWHLCFPEDTEAFLDWFFSSRFTPSLSAGCFENGRLLSVMHGSLMPLTLGRETVPTLMVSGVATEPEERGKGHMHATMLFLREQAEKQGIHILFNHPQDPDAYKRLGFLPCTETLYFEQPLTFFEERKTAPAECVPFSREAAFGIYKASIERYDCFSVRDERAFSERVKELTLDGGEAYLFHEDGLPSAYCLCHREENVLVSDEILSLGDYESVLYGLCRLSGCESIRAKLPPDTPLPGEKRVQNIMLADRETYASFTCGSRVCYSVDEY